MVLISQIISLLKNLQALLVQAFIVQNPGVVDVLTNLNVHVMVNVVQPQTGENLFVQMCFQVRKLRLFQVFDFMKDVVFVVFACFIDGIKQLDKLGVVGAGSGGVDFKSPFLCFR